MAIFGPPNWWIDSDMSDWKPGLQKTAFTSPSDWNAQESDEETP